MPRTDESIVENYRVTRALCKQGKPIWRFEVHIRKYLNGEYDAVPAGREIARTIRSSRWFVDDSEIDELADFFDEIETDWVNYYDNPTGRLNALLDELYDLADRERVWIG